MNQCTFCEKWFPSLIAIQFNGKQHKLCGVNCYLKMCYEAWDEAVTPKRTNVTEFKKGKK